MSSIVVGIAASHTPQVNTGPEVWHKHAERDRGHVFYLPDGTKVNYDELAANAPDIADELTPEVFAAKSARADAAIARLRETFAAAAPDVALVIGDDQRELFQDELIPCFALYTGPTVLDHPAALGPRSAMAPGIAEAQWAFHADGDDVYQVHEALANHLAGEVMNAGFDIASARGQYGDRTLGHAFTYPKRRIYPDLDIPMLPVFVNTYYPPNRPGAPRCYDFGVALGQALRSWAGAERIAVIATGGLSHFRVDEEFDRSIIDFIQEPDRSSLAAIPDRRFISGTAEALNWITLAGVIGGELKPELVDYVPGYRSPAGTGVGLTFARWT